MWSNVRNSSFGLLIVAAIGASLAPSCSPATAPPTNKPLTEDPTATGEGISGSVAVGTQLKATGNVNLRSKPSTSGSVLHVVAEGSIVTVVASSPSSGFYNVKHNGVTGWSYGSYYEPVASGGGGGGLPVGTVLTATGDVNLRSGPSTSDSILEVVSVGSTVTLQDSNVQNGYYNVDFNGTVGWSSSKYYSTNGGGSGGTGGSGGGSGGGSSGSGGSGAGGSTGNPAVDAAMARAESGPGFSYWWGHGRLKDGGPAGSAGSCSGSCPSCSHSGSYGADCSGFVAKVWQVPSSNKDMTSDDHPYSTGDFYSDTSQWKTVSRDSLKQADALVYRSGSSGHVFIYSSGDGWGSIYAYECKGCAAGCVKGYRTASSAYHGIRRAGF